MRDTRGITLIALIITIIVLVILAGISIASLTGENGIVEKTDTAKVKTEQATVEEKVQIAVMGSYGKDGNLDYEELKDNLDKVEGIINVPNKIEKLPLDLNVDGYKVTIEEDGSVTIVGQKTESITLEQAKEEGKILDENKPVTIKDKYDNKIVVPEGFKIASDSAEDVTGGVVIEDVSHGETVGSQFVWVPVGEIKGADKVTKTIQLNRYTFASDGTPTAQGDNVIDSYYQELASSGVGNVTAIDIEAFKTSVEKNGGYYIGRYEAANQTNVVVSKKGENIYTDVTQAQAATLSKDMYKDKKFTSDLVNSYAWDTAIVFIQEFSGDIDYSKQFSIQATFAKAGEATDGRNKDVRCNIYDMAGNAYEWTTETSWYSGHSIVGRGGYFGDNSCTTSFRGSSVPNTSFSDTSFRCVLYI